MTIRGFVPGHKVVGRYVLERILGRGGMGVVWLAQDEELEIPVALKFLPEEISRDAEAVASLKRETRRGLELAFPNIVKTYGFLKDERAAAIAMEYVDGKTLSALKAEREERPWFEVEEIAPWILSICQALDYAHNRKKVIHRDLKPINVMLSRQGEIKITDFGVAQVLQDSYSRVSANAASSGGTLIYMSPQQALGERPGVADDIYSLGATIYDLLSGKAPFGGNPSTIYIQVRDKVPPPLAERREDLSHGGASIPREWEETVAACLAKDPAQRPASAMEVAGRLGLVPAAYREPEPVPPPMPVVEPPTVAEILPPRPVAEVAEDSPVVIETAAPKETRQPREPAPPPLPVAPPAAPEVIRAPPAQPMAKPPRKWPGLVVAAAVLIAVACGVAEWHYRLGGPKREAAADAEYKAGVLDELGNGTASSVNLVSALDHFQKAADMNLPESMAELAKFHNFGLAGLTISSDEASKWGQKAMAAGLEERAQRNLPEAEVELGGLYYSGFGVPKDEAKAAEQFQKAADQGNARGEFNLALCYANGQGVEKDVGKAIALYQKAVDQGLAKAQANLGILYENGTGVERDLSKAVQLYEEAADQGESSGQFDLAVMYANGTGVEKDLSKAADLYQKAADQGNSSAQFNLGLMYQYGTGVDKDPGKAAQLYQKGADLGDADSKCALGVLYENGEGVEKDPNKAFQLYQEAANQGDVQAEFNLGLCYQKGTGVEKDDTKSVALIEKASDEGLADAECSLGYRYQLGQGVEQNVSKAVELYQKSADQGNSTGEYDLAVMYENGAGVDKDLSKAVEYYRKAADQGDTDAQAAVKRLQGRASP